MDYTVIARRFRPQAFGEVVGQEMVAQALRNAIAAGRVAHAYLFTGARGVGKTSMARILAKSLNCPNARNGDPCNQCDVCQSISAGHDVDVLEIDGASNRGIDDIRSLRSNVNVKSMRSRYKIYIIDEVHMLTKDAFNALLKTLEEPPPNVKFVFCTTEAQKLPDTILSRCQRFDFSTIEMAAIIERLRQIAEAEGVKVEPAALELVARRAAGSMRDSQSLFDQLLAFGGDSIAATDVLRLLGIASDDRLADLTDALVKRRRDKALELFDAALNSGAQLGEFVDQLLAYFRDLMVLAAGAKEIGLMSVSEEQRGVLSQQATAWGLQTCLAALQILAEAKARMKGISYGRALAELALVRISMLDDLENLSEMIQQLRSGKLPALFTVQAAARGESASSVSRVEGAVSGPAKAPHPDPLPTEYRGEREASAAAAPSLSGPDESQKKSDSEGSDRVIAAESVSVPAPTFPLEPGFEMDILAQVISNLSDMTKSHAKNITHLAISGPNHVVFTIPRSYHLSKQYLERPDQLGRLEKLVTRIVGRSVRVVLAVDESINAPSEAIPSAPKAGQSVEGGMRRLDLEHDPFVQKVIAVFGAKVIP